MGRAAGVGVSVSTPAPGVLVGVPAPGVSVAPGCAVATSGQVCSSTSICVQLLPSVQMLRLRDVFSSPRQITICLPLNVSTVLQPISGPGVDKVAVSATDSKVAVSGRTSMACATPSIQNWHSNRIRSVPVTGTPGVSVVSVAAAVADKSTVGVVSSVASGEAVLFLPFR